jgi:hypothetical protein
MATTQQIVISHPLARSEQLLVEPVGDETVIFDQRTHVAHALKPLAASVYMYADGSNSVAEIAEFAAYRLGSAVSEADVRDAIAQLVELSLIEAPEPSGVSRRTALKVFAATGAGAALITSVSASAAMAATTGQTALGNDQMCATGSSSGPGSGTVSITTNGTTHAVDYSSYSSIPNGIMIPAISPADDAGTWDNFIFPQPGITGIDIAGDTFPGINSGAGWSGAAPTVSYGGTCTYIAASKSGSTWTYSKATGAWQCIPCDGTDSYQCCSVVCGPTSPYLGYKWGSAAETAGLGGTGNPASPYLPYEGCGWNGGSDISSCASPGSPDYTSNNYFGKYCTDSQCTHDGTCKS